MDERKRPGEPWKAADWEYLDGCDLGNGNQLVIQLEFHGETPEMTPRVALEEWAVREDGGLQLVAYLLAAPAQLEEIAAALLRAAESVKAMAALSAADPPPRLDYGLREARVEE